VVGAGSSEVVETILEGSGTLGMGEHPATLLCLEWLQSLAAIPHSGIRSFKNTQLQPQQPQHQHQHYSATPTALEMVSAGGAFVGRGGFGASRARGRLDYRLPW
jgi:ribosomal protein L11 methylase PrmA